MEKQLIPDQKQEKYKMRQKCFVVLESKETI